MNILSIFKKKPYAISSTKSETTDLTITHITGVVIQIQKDGSVVVNSPSNLTLHAVGNLEITSDTHIGFAALRIDLN